MIASLLVVEVLDYSMTRIDLCVQTDSKHVCAHLFLCSGLVQDRKDKKNNPCFERRERCRANPSRSFYKMDVVATK